MKVKHIASPYSDEFETKVNEALEQIELKKKTVKEIKYRFTDRYFTALIIYS